MVLRNTNHTWGFGAQCLHWLMALLIFAMIPLGIAAKNWPLSPAKLELFFWHKSLGMALLGLAILRLLWRLINPTPALPVTLPRWERIAARATHGLFYAVMLALPLSGWVINAAAKVPFKVFGLWTLPAIVAPDKAVQTLAQQIHLTLFLLLVALVILHIGAALRHHYRLRDEILVRMLPTRSRRTGGEVR